MAYITFRKTKTGVTYHCQVRRSGELVSKTFKTYEEARDFGHVGVLQLVAGVA